MAALTSSMTDMSVTTISSPSTYNKRPPTGGRAVRFPNATAMTSPRTGVATAADGHHLQSQSQPHLQPYLHLLDETTLREEQNYADEHGPQVNARIEGGADHEAGRPNTLLDVEIESSQDAVMRETAPAMAKNGESVGITGNAALGQSTVGQDESTLFTNDFSFLQPHQESGMVDPDVVATLAALPALIGPPNELDATNSPTFPPVTAAEMAQFSQWAGAPNELDNFDFSYQDNLNGLTVQETAQSLVSMQMANGPLLGAKPNSPEPLEATLIPAYAKLVFPDGVYYMNTHSIVLGRDKRAARGAAREARERRRMLEENASGDPTPRRSRKDQSRYTKSIVSESAGILREGNDPDDEEPIPQKSVKSSKSSRKYKSSDSSQPLTRRNSLLPNNGGMFNYQAEPARRANTDEVVPVDPQTLRPSPQDCPLVAIHPGPDAPFSGYKAISRTHLKIGYSFKRNIFEAKVLGRNGAFIDERFYHPNAVIPLRSNSEIQIGGVTFYFFLPDNSTETQYEVIVEHEPKKDHLYYTENGKEMSFEFEDAPRDGAADTSEEADVENESGNDEEDYMAGEMDLEHDNPEAEAVPFETSSEDESDEEMNGQSPQPDIKETIEQAQADSTSMPLKRRGPGRPPKNGIMSKREQQIAKRLVLEKEKENEGEKIPKIESDQTTVPGKNKVGRPRKHPRPETPPEPREKRKYTKRKPKEFPPKEGEARQEGSDGEQPTKEKKEKKTPKRERSPTPTFEGVPLTEEQLAKPSANYVTLIYEALQAWPGDENSEPGQMSLPQIYRAMQRKYPFFVLKTTTNGWQSSVRHNLSQHHAFEKVKRDGKGWMWGIVKGVSIEKEKKKRSTPPPQSQQGLMPNQPLYQAGYAPHIMPYGPGMMGPPQGFPSHHQMPPNFQHGPPSYMSPHLNGLPPGQQPQMNLVNVPPLGFSPSLAPQLTTPAQTYSSPYAPKPAASNPQPHEQRLPVQQQLPQQPQHPQQQQQPQQQPQPQPQPQPQAQLPTLPQPSPSNNSQPPAPLQQCSLPTGEPSAEAFRLAMVKSEELQGAVERFKSTLITSLRETGTSNGGNIVESAVNRVLGYTSISSVPADQVKEEMIMKAFRNMLKVNMGSHKTSSHIGPQSNAASQPFRATPSSRVSTVMRPTFTGRPNGSSTPRPPLITPTIRRTESPTISAIRPGPPNSISSAPYHAQNATNGTGAFQHSSNIEGHSAILDMEIASAPELPPTHGPQQAPPRVFGHVVSQNKSLDDQCTVLECKSIAIPGISQASGEGFGEVVGQNIERSSDEQATNDMSESKGIATSGSSQLVA